MANNNEQFIDELIGKMTLEEKLGQLNLQSPSIVGGLDVPFDEIIEMVNDGRMSQEQFMEMMSPENQDFHIDDIKAGRIGGFLSADRSKNDELQRVAVEESRLGIPLIFGLDVIHGLRSVFPIALAEAGSFDDDLMTRTARMAADEAREYGVNWVYSPMLDVSRDARWGRISEGPGEDPYLGSRFAAAKIHGLQDGINDGEPYVAACPKHYIGYGAVEGGRDYNSAEMSVSTFYDVYLKPFRAAAKAGAKSMMASFNSLNGVPSTDNVWALRDVLKGELGFDGFVVSDANAIKETITHGYAADEDDAAVKALEAGVDMDMGTDIYITRVSRLVEQGRVPMDLIDDAVRRILRVKLWLGLFDHPYAHEEPVGSYDIPESHRALTLEAANKSIVLLKNEGDLLPLAKDAKVAVIGELAANPEEVCGAWAMNWEVGDCVSVFDGIGRLAPNARHFEVGGLSKPIDETQLDEAVAYGDVLIAVVGETTAMSGEASSRACIDLPGDQRELIDRLAGSGKPVVMVMMNGRPLAVGHESERATAVVEAWHLGIEMGDAVAATLFGDNNPSAKLTCTFPHISGECPCYYNHTVTGRPASKSRFTSKYTDVPFTPVYPFGWGLSYTTFDYANLAVENDADEGVVRVSADVTNAGDRDGVEVVQCYVQDVTASLVRPVRELRGYERVSLASGETKHVTIAVPYADLGFHNNDGEEVFESGAFTFSIGGNSVDLLSETVDIQF